MRNERNYRRDDRSRDSPKNRTASKTSSNNRTTDTHPSLPKRDIHLPQKTEIQSTSSSKVALNAVEAPAVLQQPAQDAPTVKRYYGRRKSNESTSSLSASSDDDKRKSSKSEPS